MKRTVDGTLASTTAPQEPRARGYRCCAICGSEDDLGSSGSRRAMMAKWPELCFFGEPQPTDMMCADGVYAEKKKTCAACHPSTPREECHAQTVLLLPWNVRAAAKKQRVVAAAAQAAAASVGSGPLTIQPGEERR